MAQQETQNLDPAAMPQLVAKLVETVEGPDPVAARNASMFLLSLAGRHEPSIRKTIVSGFLDAKSSIDAHAELVAMLLSSDPSLLLSLTPATRMRVEALLLKNANATGIAGPYAELRNPAHVLGASVAVLGEAFMTSYYKQFFDWVIDKAPNAPEFISAIKTSPALMGELLKRYLARASNSQWDQSNPFVAALPAMDTALAAALSDEDAFRIIAAVVKGADWHGYGPIELANGKFTSIPALKVKAVLFAATNPVAAEAVTSSFGLHISPPAFASKYF